MSGVRRDEMLDRAVRHLDDAKVYVEALSTSVGRVDELPYALRLSLESTYESLERSKALIRNLSDLVQKTEYQAKAEPEDAQVDVA